MHPKAPIIPAYASKPGLSDPCWIGTLALKTGRKGLYSKRGCNKEGGVQGETGLIEKDKFCCVIELGDLYQVT